MKRPYAIAMLLALPAPMGLIGMMCSEGVVRFCWFVVTALPIAIAVMRFRMQRR